MRKVRGVDFIVALNEKDGSPSLVSTKVKWFPHDIQSRFSQRNTPVFIANGNDQYTPEKNRGLLCYFDNYGIVGAIIAAEGPTAIVFVLAPLIYAQKIIPVDLRYAGIPLQQVYGLKIWNFNTNFRWKNIDATTGTVVPLTDNHGFIKANKHGPDIMSDLPTVPKEYKRYLKDHWVEHSKKKKQDYEKKSDLVPVVYILFRKGWNPKYVRYKGKGKNKKGFYNVPVGDIITAGTGIQR